MLPCQSVWGLLDFVALLDLKYVCNLLNSTRPTLSHTLQHCVLSHILDLIFFHRKYLLMLHNTMKRWKNLMFVYLQIGNSIFKQVNIYLQNLIVAHYFFLNVIYWLILHSITLLLQFPCLITFEFCSNKSFNWEVFQGRKTISVCWCWRSDLILGCRPGLPRLVSTGKGFKF